MTDALSPAINAVLFAAAAAAIWWAGTRLEHDADLISRRTGLGQAFSGMLLLAAATSLPEVATTVTAIVILENPTLAVHNLLGGVALQTAILALADRFKGRRGALTFFSPRFVLLIEGVGLVFLLQLTTAGMMARGVPAAPISNVYGSNAFDVMLLFLADILYRKARSWPTRNVAWCSSLPSGAS